MSLYLVLNVSGSMPIKTYLRWQYFANYLVKSLCFFMYKQLISSKDIVFINLKWTFQCNVVWIQSVDSISKKYQMNNIRILFSISVQYGFAFIYSNRSFYSQPLHTYGNMWGLERSCLTRCSKQHTLSCVFIYLSHVWKPLGTL